MISRDRFIASIQIYNIYDLLKHLSILSIECLFNKDKKIASSVIMENFSLPTNRYKRKPLYITPWNLIDIVYYSVLYRNDMNNHVIESREQLLYIIAAYTSFSAEKESESSFINKQYAGSDTDFLLYVFGFLGEQVRFQTPLLVFENYCREKYILFKFSSLIDNEINIENIVQSEIGLASDKVSIVLFYLWGIISTSRSCIINPHIIAKKNIEVETIEAVLHYYSIDITESLEGLSRQTFYAKPFIKMKDNSYLCINIFLLLFLFENSTYWIIRNYFLTKGQKFINAFGVYFEQYTEELFNIYLDSTTFQRIDEGLQKRADWILIIGNYEILVEQKSALAGIKAKQQESDFNETKKYVIRNWIKAITQLSKTQEDYGKKYIKWILTYDKYYQAEALEYAFSLPECQIEDDGYYWLISIDELEMLLHTYKFNHALFKDVMEVKISLEISKSRDGRSLSMIMQKLGFSKNEHIKQDIFQHLLKDVEYAVLST